MKKTTAVLSIVACGMLEDELAHILCNDHSLRHLILIDSPEALGLSRKLGASNRAHLVMKRDLVQDHIGDIRKARLGWSLASIGDKIKNLLLGHGQMSTGHELIVVVDMLNKALHSDEKLLRDGVHGSIKDLAIFSGSVLLFFGLCGNALADIAEDLIELPCPIHFLEDSDGKRIDDCIAAAFGGNKEYEKALISFPGVGFFFTPMWAYHWQEIDRDVRKSTTSKSKGLGSMLRDLGYSKVAKLDTGLRFISDFEVESKICDFAAQHNLEIIRLRGGSDLALRCYIKAKESLARECVRYEPILQ